MVQDPLALLSDSGGSDSDSAEREKKDQGYVASARGADVPTEHVRLDPAKRRRILGCSEFNATDVGTTVRFEDLQLAGYMPTELLESASYLRDAEGQEARRALLGPQSPVPQEETVLDECKEEEEEVMGERRKLSCARPLPCLQVSGDGPVPPEWTSFDDAFSTDGVGLPTELINPLLAAGFEAPTPIQSHAWPILLHGRDLIGVAQTGSGKTLAYLLPCLAQLLVPSARKSIVHPGSPPALILAPTRELVCQIEREADRFRKCADIRTAAVYGGAPSVPQLAGLRGHPLVVAATPGRLMDLMERAKASCSLCGVKFLVLDEGDRMLDEGFEPQLREIAKQASSPHRQTMFFSATWPVHVQRLAREFLNNPVELCIGATDTLRANPDVAQDVVLLGDECEKVDALVGILTGRSRSRALVFVSTKRSCRELARAVRGRIPGRSEEIHGDRCQRDREMALANFRAGVTRVLFATDVAGRGLDICGVGLIVNFDPPRSAEDYVHRIGRTGRAGEPGLALSLLTWRDGSAAQYIADVANRTGVPVPKALAHLLRASDAKDAALDRRQMEIANSRAKREKLAVRLSSIEDRRGSLWSSRCSEM